MYQLHNVSPWYTLSRDPSKKYSFSVHSILVTVVYKYKSQYWNGYLNLQLQKYNTRFTTDNHDCEKHVRGREHDTRL